ncbi:MAG: DUF177 domain-containing protein [Chloroflexota bacterium]|nr:DUF177 domain-containing protein [Chloroflexota bacterium]
MAPETYNDLAFNVAGLLKETVGATRTHELQLPELPLDENAMASNLHGEARLLRIRTGVLVEGTVEADVTLECSRCLIGFSEPIEGSLEEEYRPLADMITGIPIGLQEGETEDDFSRISEGNILDLTELVRQSILVAVPVNPLHSPDCAGLCPECGADLNVEDCGHTRESGDPRLAGLASLLDKLD